MQPTRSKSLLTHPLVFILTALLPHAVLLCFAVDYFSFIYSLLNPSQLATMYRVGGVSLGMILGWACAATLYVYKKRHIEKIFAIGSLVSHIVLIYFIYGNFDHLFPLQIPPWVGSAERWALAPLTGLMPAVLCSIFMLVWLLTPPASQKAWRSFLGILAVPLLSYLSFQYVSPLLRQLPHDEYWQHAYALFGITLLVVFIFTIFRWLLVLSRKKTLWGGVILRVFFCLLFPLLGLYLNTAFPSLWAETAGNIKEGIFGDFSHPLFDFLALLNGLILVLPRRVFHSTSWNLVRFAALCVTLPFSIYFFVTFLPFVPIAAIGVFFYGAGLLVLTPTVAAYFHLRSLSESFVSIPTRFRKQCLIAGITCAGLIPLILWGNFLLDSLVLQRALKEIYTPNFQQLDRPGVNTERLSRVLARIQADKKRSNITNGLYAGDTPFISVLYRSIVLHGLTLSDEIIAKLSKLHNLSYTPAAQKGGFNTDARAVLSSFSVSTEHDREAGALKSTVTLSTSTDISGPQEFRSEFNLPPGAWISGYGLVIEGVLIPGQVIEQQSALWIFNQIRNERRDPGLLRYVSPDTLQLRVFPVTTTQSRQTQFTILHVEPFDLTIAGVTKRLEAVEQFQVPLKEITTGDVIYIPSAKKAQLRSVTRTPFFYFIVDCRLVQHDASLATMRSLAQTLPSKKTQVISGTRSFTHIEANAEFPNVVHDCPRDGGFDLEFALKSVLLSAYYDPSDHYPVAVVVTNETEQLQNIKLDTPFLDLIPEYRGIISITDGKISVRPNAQHQSATTLTVDNLLVDLPVLAFAESDEPPVYISATATPSIILRRPSSQKSPLTASTHWQEGLDLHGRWLSRSIAPSEETDEMWRAHITKSRALGILTPLTSYITLESDLQREALRRMQDKRLSQGRFMNAGDVRRMDEPSGVLIIGVFALFLYLRRKRALRKSAPEPNLDAL